MEEWLILHLFYHTLNTISKSMLATAAGGTFMGKEIEIAKKLRNDMQDNHSQWHVERSSTKKVNSVTEGVNEDLTAKVDELIGIIKGKEEVQVAITNAKVEEIDFIARNFNPAWKIQNYGSNYQKPYPNHAGVPNKFNNGGNNGNRQSLEDSLKTFMQSQTGHNNLVVKLIGNHEAVIGQLSKQVVTMKTEVNDLQDRTRHVETQLGKIADSQGLILANLVKSPLCKRPGERYRLQVRGWDVWFRREALTRVALLDQISGVLACSWPVKPCPKSFGDKCSAARVMPIGAFVYLSKQAFSIFECDAPLKYARYASFVKFASYHCICFGSSGDAPCLCWIFG
jgi:hypothetical protein